jgi:hypothetical protein
VFFDSVKMVTTLFILILRHSLLNHVIFFHIKYEVHWKTSLQSTFNLSTDLKELLEALTIRCDKISIYNKRCSPLLLFLQNESHVLAGEVVKQIDALRYQSFHVINLKLPWHLFRVKNLAQYINYILSCINLLGKKQ